MEFFSILPAMTGAVSPFGAFVFERLAQLGRMLMLFGEILRTAFTRRPQ
jgi:hypothetical protein